MVHSQGQQPPGWYYAHGDPTDTQRYWDGTAWVGAPQPVPGSEVDVAAPKASVPLPRIAARIIDWLIWAVIFTIVGVFGPDGRGIGILIRAITVALVLLYETGMVIGFGATLGKMTLNLLVSDSEGSSVSTEPAIRRSLILAVVGLIWIAGGWSLWMEALAWPIILGVTVFGFVALFGGGSRQTPWDRVADSMVVSK